MGRYKKWSELSFFERIGREKYSYEKARIDAENNDLFCECLFCCCTNKETRKCCCYFISFILILAVIILIFLSFSAPYYFIYVAFCSERTELFLNNQNYYDYFTSLNNGIQYESEKLKLAYINIPSAIIYTFTLTSFLIPKLYDNMKAKSFLILFLLTNSTVVVLDVLNILFFSKMINTFEIFAKYLYEKHNITKK